MPDSIDHFHARGEIDLHTSDAELERRMYLGGEAIRRGMNGGTSTDQDRYDKAASDVAHDEWISRYGGSEEDTRTAAEKEEQETRDFLLNAMTDIPLWREHMYTTDQLRDMFFGSSRQDAAKEKPAEVVSAEVPPEHKPEA